MAELVLHYDGGPPYYGVSILEFRGDKVARETIYGGEAWEAPEWPALSLRHRGRTNGRRHDLTRVIPTG